MSAAPRPTSRAPPGTAFCPPFSAGCPSCRRLLARPGRSSSPLRGCGRSTWTHSSAAGLTSPRPEGRRTSNQSPCPGPRLHRETASGTTTAARRAGVQTAAASSSRLPECRRPVRGLRAGARVRKPEPGTPTAVQQLDQVALGVGHPRHPPGHRRRSRGQHRRRALLEQVGVGAVEVRDLQRHMAVRLHERGIRRVRRRPVRRRRALAVQQLHAEPVGRAQHHEPQAQRCDGALDVDDEVEGVAPPSRGRLEVGDREAHLVEPASRRSCVGG